MALGGKQRDGGDVGGAIEQLGRGRGVQEVIAQQPHKQKNEETAGARAEEAVIKADDHADQAGRQHFGPARKAGCVVPPQLFLGQRVDQHPQQHQGQQLAQEVGRHHGHGPGACKRPRKTGRCRGQHGRPANLHLAAVLPGGHGRAPHRGRLVGAQQRGRGRPGESRKQGRHHHQPATPHDGIHEACEQRGKGNKNPFHRRIFAACLLWIQDSSGHWRKGGQRRTGKKKALGSPAPGKKRTSLGA